MVLNRQVRRGLTAAAGLALATVPALALPARPALILPPTLSEKAEIAGHLLSIRDYEFAMLMMAKMLPGVGGQGSGGAGASIADYFDIRAGTTTALDALSTTGWDLLIGKSRVNATGWTWRNSVRGLSSTLASNSTGGESSFTSYTSNLSNGETVLYRAKRAAKFLDIVTWSGNATDNRKISHALTVAPGLVIVKNVSSGAWYVLHRSLSADTYLFLNTTVAQTSSVAGAIFGDGTNIVAPTASEFTIGSNSNVNGSGSTYVGFVIAHDSASTGLVQCGSFTADGSGAASIATGWPNGSQFVMIKAASGASGSWIVLDTARTPSFSGNDARLFFEDPDTETSAALVSQSGGTLSVSLSPSVTYVYWVIRAP